MKAMKGLLRKKIYERNRGALKTGFEKKGVG